MEFVIAAGHEETARVAGDILFAGGNAADAATAAFFASWVAEPCMASAGGGAFVHYFSAGQQEALVFDGFCQTPGRKIPASRADFFPIEVNFGDTVEPFHVGLGSTAVPGAVACVFSLHGRYGSIPITELVQPAIQLAREGVAVNRFQRYLFTLLEPILKLSERGRQIYFPRGALIGVGERLQMPGMADFLDYLSREGEDAFYRGEVARKTARDYEAGGGHLRMEDLGKYRVETRPPLAVPYGGATVLTNPAPSLGGPAIAHLLLSLPGKEDMPALFSRKYIRAWLKAQRESWRLLRRPGALHESLANKLARRLGSTTHLSIVDKAGNAVGLTASNGEGCGYFMENTDIQLNNMLGEAALLPAGFDSWEPATRLPSMMAPTLLLDQEKQLAAVLGSGGAGRIATAISQVVCLLEAYGLPVEAAVEAPRLHLGPNALNLEPGFQEAFLDEDTGVAILYWKRKSMFFGGVNAVARKGKEWMVAGDRRRDGHVLVG